MRKSLAFVGVVLLAHSLPVLAAVHHSYGRLLHSYKQSVADGGGCISGSIGSTVPLTHHESGIEFRSDIDGSPHGPMAFFSYNADDYSTHFVPGVSAFTMCLKPGRYHITGVHTDRVRSAEPIDIPFDVMAGKNFYLGSFIIHGYGSAPECARPFVPAYVVVRDDIDRDAPAIQEAPEAKSLLLVKQLINPKLGEPYFVVCSEPAA